MTIPTKRQVVAETVAAWEAQVVARYLADSTLTVTALAAEMGVHRVTAMRLLDRHRVAIRPYEPARNVNVAAMISLLEDGETLQQVGERFGISGERVRQLVTKAGYGERPAQAIKVASRRMAKDAERGAVQRERRAMLRRIGREKRERLIGVVRQLAPEYGGSPPLGAVAEASGLDVPSIARLFVGRGFRDPHYGSRGTARLYRLAGATVRPHGHWGHVR